MKITHNKVGQNINLVDGLKQEKTEGARGLQSKDLKVNADEKINNKVAQAEATRVDVSSQAQDAKRIKEIALATPDVDEAKVEKFRKLIEEGKYQVDAKAVADKMVDEHLETMN